MPTDEERLKDAALKLVHDLWAYFIDDEGSEIERYDFLDMAVTAGLMEWVEYDPDKHGEIEDVEPGDRAWIPTELGRLVTAGWLDKLVNHDA